MNSAFTGVVRGGTPTGYQASLPATPPELFNANYVTQGFEKYAPPEPYEDWVGSWGTFEPGGWNNTIVTVTFPANRALKRANIQLNGSSSAAWDTYDGLLYPVGVIKDNTLMNSAYEYLNIAGPNLRLAFTLKDVPGHVINGNFIDCYVWLDDDSLIQGQLVYPL